MFREFLQINAPEGGQPGDSAGQGVTGHKKINKTTSVKTKDDTPPAPETFNFTDKSAWADMTANLTNFHSHFLIKIESSSPVEKWILKDLTNTEIDSGSLNNAYTFVVDHPGEFKKGMSLTLMIYKDGLQYPSLLKLQ